MFISHVCFIFCCFFLHCCLLVLYLFDSHLLFGFFVYVNIPLQQSTCIMFISCVVGFALSCCVLSSCCLLHHFPHCCLGLQFFCF
jgi:hypothetical protein